MFLSNQPKYAQAQGSNLPNMNLPQTAKVVSSGIEVEKSELRKPKYQNKRLAKMVNELTNKRKGSGKMGFSIF